jgi:hypothetical protein
VKVNGERKEEHHFHDSGLHMCVEWHGSGMMGKGGSGRGCSHSETSSSSGLLSSLQVVSV